MKCFLHIGTPKTATKTIQSFLESNRTQLKQHGFAYLRGKSDYRSYYRFVMLAYPPSRRDRYTLLQNIKTDEELEKFQRDMFIEAQKELVRTVRGRKDLSVIISSELFQGVLITHDDLLRLKEVLYRLGFDDIQVVVYLRNQPEFADSLFSTWIKLGSVDTQFVAPEHPLADVCDHRKTIERFSAVFGEKAILPRIFHRSRLKEGCIIRDFCDAIGIPVDSSYRFPNRENESLSSLGVSLLRRVNALVPPFVDTGENLLRRGIEKKFTTHFSQTKYSMPRDLSVRYEEAFAGSNEWVRQHYFPALPSLFPKEHLHKENPVVASDAELDAIANYIGDVWVKYARFRQENKHLLKVDRIRLRVIKTLIGLSVFLTLACAALLIWGH
jgi:hypothetical protein